MPLFKNGTRLRTTHLDKPWSASAFTFARSFSLFKHTPFLARLHPSNVWTSVLLLNTRRNWVQSRNTKHTTPTVRFAPIYTETRTHTRGGVELHTHSASRGYPTHSANPDREGLIPKVVVSTGTHFLFPSPVPTHSTAASSTCVHPVDLHIQHTSRTHQRSPG